MSLACRNYGLQLYQDEEVLKPKLHLGDITSDEDFVKSLTADGHFAHVWTGYVLHVLNEAKTEALIRSVFTLLRPGGTFFGDCRGSPDTPKIWLPGCSNRNPAFLHTLDSLRELLIRLGFVEVIVNTCELPKTMDKVRHFPCASSRLLCSLMTYV